MQARTPSPTLEESTLVERVARIVSSVRGTKPDYAHLASELEPAIPFDVFGIALLRHDRQAVRVTVCKREGEGWIAQHHQHPLADSMVERILHAASLPREIEDSRSEENSSRSTINASPGSATAATMIISHYPAGLDGSPAECGDALSGNPYLHATLIVPLLAGERVLGTLELGSGRIYVYDDETLQRLIGAVARVLAAAIESAQVGGSVEIQDRQRQELKNVSHALTAEMDLPMILNRIVVGIAKALGVVASAIVTVDRRSGRLRLEAQYGLDEAALKRIIGQEASWSEQTIIGYTLLHQQPCVSQNIAEDERFPASSLFARELVIHSIFSYPLVIGSTVYGALLLCSSEPGGFTPLKEDILSLFAGQATIAIHNGILLESVRERRRFQDVIERLEHVLSSVSHELRTPLTTIKAAVTGLLQPDIEWDEHTRREILEEIDAESDHLEALVNSIVEMSRIEMGALVLDKEWCDVAEIVHGTLTRAERMLAGHPVRIVFEPQLPLVQADYVQLERVFRNLIENAVRRSPVNSKICITLESVSRKSLGIDLPGTTPRFLRARVIDHGSKLAEEERESIFTSSYSSDSQISGLGLAICRGIIEAHQGAVWVEPKSQGESCFVFVLPVFS